MQIILIRHGQTQLNSDRRIQGWIDLPLTDTGRQEAIQLAKQLCLHRPVHHLYTSPLKRAKQTAREIGRELGLRTVLLDAVKELNVGEIDGLERTTIMARFPGLIERWIARDPSLEMPGGEKLADFKKRVQLAFKELEDRYAGKTVAVVTHGVVLNVYLSSLLGEEYGKPENAMKNASFTIIELCSHQARIILYNQIAHLSL